MHTTLHGFFIGVPFGVVSMESHESRWSQWPKGESVAQAAFALLFSAKIGFEPKWFFRVPASAGRPHMTLYLGRRHSSDALNEVVSPA